MSRVKSAINVLLGLSEDPITGGRFPVKCRPEAWRCSVCGGRMVKGPKGKPMIHVHRHPSECAGKSTGLSVRYVGVGAHARRVWVALWENRPRVVRRAPRAGDDVSRGVSAAAYGFKDRSNRN